MSFRGRGIDGAMDFRQLSDAALDAMLARQSSIYSLTFDEFQSTMGGFGKDFGSMNIDEFLKSVWTAEESQAGAYHLSMAGLSPRTTPPPTRAPATSSPAAVDHPWQRGVGKLIPALVGKLRWQRKKRPPLAMEWRNKLNEKKNKLRKEVAALGLEKRMVNSQKVYLRMKVLPRGSRIRPQMKIPSFTGQGLDGWGSRCFRLFVLPAGTEPPGLGKETT
ncbi:ABSCISIC ACID-INSENSITIVE 5-like protein 7 [Platanthera guangdongensis]|uniref:ABSCISIC ACID-INSENSITIVE 5-like protein 7 n=1 Tax=Platanthera guangdongensis TaxID=2320717 RepID=A0ABR2LPD4_9ASPA